MSGAALPPSPQGLREKLFTAGYIADEDVASLVWMALSLERPVLLEGEAGV
ncbi:MAG: MoxR family ATPase, partial [Betaproteobacteria bacterium]|nr:MoxR family ATPase [Betaproteobacteria bacterium]